MLFDNEKEILDLFISLFVGDIEMTIKDGRTNLVGQTMHSIVSICHFHRLSLFQALFLFTMYLLIDYPDRTQTHAHIHQLTYLSRIR